MAPHQAHRTLVKSRPELWAEVSDVEALCRHLGEFGEITITRLEPESTVAWEGTAARGTVELESSGWGTKVTLTAELVDDVEPPAVGQPEAEHDPSDEASAVAETAEPEAAVEPEPDPEPALVAEPAPEPVAEPEPEPVVPSPAAVRAAERAQQARTVPAPRRGGFLSRLFGRRSPAPPPAPPVAETVPPVVAPPVLETPPAPAPDPEPAPPLSPLRLVPDPDDAPAPEPIPGPETDDDDGPLVAEAVDTPRVLDGDRAVEVLTAALDDLGAAHRRPFSHS